MGKYGKKWRRVRNGTKNKQYGGGGKIRVARFFLVQNTKTGKYISNTIK
jgi:hypothetical protein